MAGAQFKKGHEGWQTLLHAQRSCLPSALRLSCQDVPGQLVGGHAAHLHFTYVTCLCGICKSAITEGSSTGRDLELERTGGGGFGTTQQQQPQQRASGDKENAARLQLGVGRPPKKKKKPQSGEDQGPLFNLWDWYYHCNNLAPKKCFLGQNLLPDTTLKESIYVDTDDQQSGTSKRVSLSTFAKSMVRPYFVVKPGRVCTLQGQLVQVLWWNEPRPEASRKYGVWYSGVVDSVDESTGLIKIQYNDGDVGEVHIGLNFVHFGCEPPKKGSRAQLPPRPAPAGSCPDKPISAGRSGVQASAALEPSPDPPHSFVGPPVKACSAGREQQPAVVAVPTVDRTQEDDCWIWPPPNKRCRVEPGSQEAGSRAAFPPGRAGSCRGPSPIPGPSPGEPIKPGDTTSGDPGAASAAPAGAATAGAATAGAAIAGAATAGAATAGAATAGAATAGAATAGAATAAVAAPAAPELSSGGSRADPAVESGVAGCGLDRPQDTSREAPRPDDGRGEPGGPEDASEAAASRDASCPGGAGDAGVSEGAGRAGASTGEPAAGNSGGPALGGEGDDEGAATAPAGSGVATATALSTGTAPMEGGVMVPDKNEQVATVPPDVGAAVATSAGEVDVTSDEEQAQRPLLDAPAPAAAASEGSAEMARSPATEGAEEQPQSHAGTAAGPRSGSRGRDAEGGQSGSEDGSDLGPVAKRRRAGSPGVRDDPQQQQAQEHHRHHTPDDLQQQQPAQGQQDDQRGPQQGPEPRRPHDMTFSTRARASTDELSASMARKVAQGDTAPARSPSTTSSGKAQGGGSSAGQATPLVDAGVAEPSRSEKDAHSFDQEQDHPLAVEPPDGPMGHQVLQAVAEPLMAVNEPDVASVPVATAEEQRNATDRGSGEEGRSQELAGEEGGVEEAARAQSASSDLGPLAEDDARIAVGAAFEETAAGDVAGLAAAEVEPGISAEPGMSGSEEVLVAEGPSRHPLDMAELRASSAGVVTGVVTATGQDETGGAETGIATDGLEGSHPAATALMSLTADAASAGVRSCSQGGAGSDGNSGGGRGGVSSCGVGGEAQGEGDTWVGGGDGGSGGGGGGKGDGGGGGPERGAPGGDEAGGGESGGRGDGSSGEGREGNRDGSGDQTPRAEVDGAEESAEQQEVGTAQEEQPTQQQTSPPGGTAPADRSSTGTTAHPSTAVPSLAQAPPVSATSVTGPPRVGGPVERCAPVLLPSSSGPASGAVTADVQGSGPVSAQSSAEQAAVAYPSLSQPQVQPQVQLQPQTQPPAPAQPSPQVPKALPSGFLQPRRQATKPLAAPTAFATGASRLGSSLSAPCTGPLSAGCDGGSSTLALASSYMAAHALRTPAAPPAGMPAPAAPTGPTGANLMARSASAGSGGGVSPGANTAFPGRQSPGGAPLMPVFTPATAAAAVQNLARLIGGPQNFLALMQQHQQMVAHTQVVNTAALNPAAGATASAAGHVRPKVPAAPPVPSGPAAVASLSPGPVSPPATTAVPVLPTAAPVPAGEGGIAPCPRMAASLAHEAPPPVLSDPHQKAWFAWYRIAADVGYREKAAQALDLARRRIVAPETDIFKTIGECCRDVGCPEVHKHVHYLFDLQVAYVTLYAPSAAEQIELADLLVRLVKGLVMVATATHARAGGDPLLQPGEVWAIIEAARHTAKARVAQSAGAPGQTPPSLPPLIPLLRAIAKQKDDIAAAAAAAAWGDGAHGGAAPAAHWLERFDRSLMALAAYQAAKLEQRRSRLLTVRRSLPSEQLRAEATQLADLEQQVQKDVRLLQALERAGRTIREQRQIWQQQQQLMHAQQQQQEAPQQHQPQQQQVQQHVQQPQPLQQPQQPHQSQGVLRRAQTLPVPPQPQPVPHQSHQQQPPAQHHQRQPHQVPPHQQPSQPRSQLDGPPALWPCSPQVTAVPHAGLAAAEPAPAAQPPVAAPPLAVWPTDAAGLQNRAKRRWGCLGPRKLYDVLSHAGRRASTWQQQQQQQQQQASAQQAVAAVCGERAAGAPQEPEEDLDLYDMYAGYDVYGVQEDGSSGDGGEDEESTEASGGAEPGGAAAVGGDGFRDAVAAPQDPLVSSTSQPGPDLIATAPPAGTAPPSTSTRSNRSLPTDNLSVRKAVMQLLRSKTWLQGLAPHPGRGDRTPAAPNGPASAPAGSAPACVQAAAQALATDGAGSSGGGGCIRGTAAESTCSEVPRTSTPPLPAARVTKDAAEAEAASTSDLGLPKPEAVLDMDPTQLDTAVRQVLRRYLRGPGAAAAAAAGAGVDVGSAGDSRVSAGDCRAALGEAAPDGRAGASARPCGAGAAPHAPRAADPWFPPGSNQERQDPKMRLEMALAAWEGLSQERRRAVLMAACLLGHEGGEVDGEAARSESGVVAQACMQAAAAESLVRCLTTLANVAWKVLEAECAGGAMRLNAA